MRLSDVHPRFYRVMKGHESWSFSRGADGHVWIGLGWFVFTTQPGQYPDIWDRLLNL